MKKNERIFVYLCDDNNMLYDVRGPLLSDEIFVLSVQNGIERGLNIHMSLEIDPTGKSLKECIAEPGPWGYTYQEGLFEKLGIDY